MIQTFWEIAVLCAGCESLTPASEVTPDEEADINSKKGVHTRNSTEMGTFGSLVGGASLNRMADPELFSVPSSKSKTDMLR